MQRPKLFQYARVVVGEGLERIGTLYFTVQELSLRDTQQRHLVVEQGMIRVFWEHEYAGSIPAN